MGSTSNEKKGILASLTDKVANAVANKIAEDATQSAPQAQPGGMGSTSSGPANLPPAQMSAAYTRFAGPSRAMTREALVGAYAGNGISIDGYRPVNPYAVLNGIGFKQYILDYIDSGSIPFTTAPVIVGNGNSTLMPPPKFSKICPPGVLITFGDSDLNFVKETIIELTVTYVTEARDTTDPNVEIFNISLNNAGGLLLFGLDSPDTGSTNLAAPEISRLHRGVGTWTNGYRVEVNNAWATLRTTPQILPADHPLWAACLSGEEEICAVLSKKRASSR